MNHQPLVLVCAADNEFAMSLAAMVCSVMANLPKCDRILLFIIDGGISDRNQRKILQSLDLNRVTVTWLQPPAERLNRMKVSQRIPITSYYRLLIPELLPLECNQAIYLDTDLVVNTDLGQLWQMEMGDNAVLAVQDPIIRTVSSKRGLADYQALGIAPDAKYFNAGVLAINLAYWRTHNISQKILHYLEANLEKLRWHDQDGLNAILAGQWGELDPRWNQLHIIYRYKSWQDSPYSENIYQSVLEQPYIVHFTTSGKPWRAGCQHPKRDLFYHYLDLTAWSGWRPTLWRRGIRKLETVLQQTF